jgi:hypothetical protein
MAYFAQDGGGVMLPGTQKLMQQFGTPSAPAGAPSSGSAGVTPEEQRWIDWQRHFQRSGMQYIGYGPSGAEGAAARPTGLNKRVREEHNIIVRDRKRLATLAAQIGVDVRSPSALGILWLDAVDEAQKASLVNPETDPWMVLQAWASGVKYTGSAAKTGESLAGTRTTTDKQFNITDAKTAKEVIRAALRQRLQRDPTKDEIATFIARLMGEEKSNPDIATTTTTTDEEGNVVSQESTVEEGAPAPGDVAESYLTEEHDPEADAIRAGQEFFAVAQQLARPVV